MIQYHNFLEHIIKYGRKKGDRTGTGTLSAIVPPAMRFDLRDGFPIATTKEIDFDNIKFELKWFTRGDTNIKYLLDNKVNIWNGDAYRWYQEHGGTLDKREFIDYIKTNSSFANAWGYLGPIYGKQWRGWEVPDFENGFCDGSTKEVDQLSNIIEWIEEIKKGDMKYDRRLIVSAWNAGVISEMALPPCHVMMQFFVYENELSCHLYQRSGDAFLGIPYNISSYALLTHIIAQQTGLVATEFIHTVGDAHIYLNHLDQVVKQLTREPKRLPLLVLPDDVTIDNWQPEDVKLYKYEHHPKIKGDLSV